MSGEKIQVPVKVDDVVVGYAVLENEGQIVVTTTVPGMWNHWRELFLFEYADGLNIRPNYDPALEADAMSDIKESM